MRRFLLGESEGAPVPHPVCAARPNASAPQARHVALAAVTDMLNVGLILIEPQSFARPRRRTEMSQIPSIDYTCARCGARSIYQLVPLEERPTEEQVRAIPHDIPSIDLRCSQCGASQTYKLVPGAAAT